jgi:uncharacterized repeat protein (TIGR04138 family)
MRLAGELADEALWAALDALAARTGRSVEGYKHVHDVFAHLHAQAGGRHHVSPAVLIESFREFTVTRCHGHGLVFMDLWGITCTEDLGAFAMDLVDAKLVEAHASDRRRDFAGGFDFESAFPITSPGPEAMRAATVESVVADLGQRFTQPGFLFLYDVVAHAQARFGGGHVSGAQFLESFRLLSRSRFGADALDVLAKNGIRRTEDVGEMVFALVDRGLMGASPEDERSDFDAGFDFAEAFPR